MRILPLLFVLLAAGGATSSPAAKPSGQITFWSDRDGDPDVFTMNADGSNARNLGRPGWGDKRASWSPDGTKIAYDSWDVGHRDFDIWIMRADGTDKTQLTTSPLRDTLPAWSPDGRWIAFTRKRARSTAEDVWLIHPDRTGEHRLVAGASGAAWSPDGKRLVFSRYSDVWLSDVNGRNLHRLTRMRGFESPAAGGCSPDGRTILFTHWPIGGFGDVFVMSPRGTSVRRLTTSKADDTDPSWSPDGNQIVFDSTRDGNREVYLMNRDGSGQRNISHNPAEDWADTWRPQG